MSSSPVGSSAKSTSGSFARATAIATRCCSPPERRSGRWSSRSPSPTSSSRTPRPLGASGPAVEGHRQLDVLLGREVRQEVPRGLLPDHPDDAAPVARPLAAAHLAEVVAGDDGPAGRRRVEPAEDVQERRLAAARRADDRDHLADADDEIEALEGDDLEIGDLVDPDEPLADDLAAVAGAGRVRFRPGAARLGSIPADGAAGSTTGASPNRVPTVEPGGATAVPPGRRRTAGRRSPARADRRDSSSCRSSRSSRPHSMPAPERRDGRPAPLRPGRQRRSRRRRSRGSPPKIMRRAAADRPSAGPRSSSRRARSSPRPGSSRTNRPEPERDPARNARMTVGPCSIDREPEGVAAGTGRSSGGGRPRSRGRRRPGPGRP